MWSMPISLTLHPSRTVTDPDGAKWTVAVARGNQWPGWAWLNWLEGWGWAGDAAPVALALGLLALPSVTARWLGYRLRRRTDWRVTVRRGEHTDEQATREAVINELHPSKEAAAERGEQLAALIGRGETVEALHE
jgi:hypothetical protein